VSAVSDASVDLLLSVNDHHETGSLVDLVQRAEELGYEYVSMGETTGWNRVSILTLLATETDEIGLANDVFSPYSRSPALLGQTAATLDEVSDGRYRMGLGTSSPALVESWHGQEFERPLRRLRETIDIVRQVLSGERVDYDGDIFDVGGLRLASEPPSPTPPIDVACLGPKTTELTGRFADGWVPQLFTPDGLRERLSDLERGAELGDRSIDDVRVSPILRCIADEDREQARATARRGVAFMLAAYGPYYGKSVARQGWEETVERLRESWEANHDTEELAELLPDELLDELAAAGTPEEVRERVESFASIDGVDAVRVGSFEGQPLETTYATIEAITE